MLLSNSVTLVAANLPTTIGSCAIVSGGVRQLLLAKDASGSYLLTCGCQQVILTGSRERDGTSQPLRCETQQVDDQVDSGPGADLPLYNCALVYLMKSPGLLTMRKTWKKAERLVGNRWLGLTKKDMGFDGHCLG
ncbi:hypothetical protein E3N88_40546 [Mikania micrantha]|uniref:Uncharacterized protein n=1 Tax=Mikania micrantha TaxID=192012 RepID=A0A5N6LN08_9ASTR|nr:hypothetical protein E3N88_40546 [Mikania micrantha]